MSALYIYIYMKIVLGVNICLNPIIDMRNMPLQRKNIKRMNVMFPIIFKTTSCHLTLYVNGFKL